MSRIAIFALFATMIFLAGCGGQSAPEAVTEPERIAVEVTTARHGELTITKTYSGTVEGIEHADLSAKLSETVESINVRLGDQVENGQVLVSLDPGGPGSSYHQAEAVYENNRRLLNKYRNLYDEGAVSENELDNIRTQYKVSRADFNAAREMVKIVAPFDGRVTALDVNYGDQVLQGEKLATVSRTDSVRVTIGVDPDDVDYVQVGDTVRLGMRGRDKDNPVIGIVERVSASADPETRAFAVEIIAANPENRLKVGSLATAELELRTIADALLVPREAVRIQKGIPRLFFLEGDTAQSVEVELGNEDEENVQILSGVESGWNVVVLGQSFLNDGSLVNVINRRSDNQ